MYIHMYMAVRHMICVCICYIWQQDTAITPYNTFKSLLI